MKNDEDFKDAIREAVFHKSKKKKRGLAALKRKMNRRTKDRDLEPEVRILLSQANEAFVRNDIHVAQDLYKEVIQKDPKNFGAYKTLGEIYKQQGKLEECCTAWFCAAHINNWDYEFWASVAELSHDLGNSTQAIYCFKRGIAASNGTDMKSIFNRAVIYREIGHSGRALEGFQKLHKAFPTDINVVKELAMCYVEQNRTNDAINVYLRIFDQNMREAEGEYPVFEWSELNILAELYAKLGLWEPCVQIITVAARWLSDRADETWWTGDEEFDAARYTVHPAYAALSMHDQQKNRALPIDIRVKLGFCRLNMKEADEALHHFAYLFEEELTEIADLHLEVGKVLEQLGMYEDALRFLEPLLGQPEFSDVGLVLSLSNCWHETGRYRDAERGYLSVLEADPDNLDVKLAIAETYFHVGSMAKSQAYIREVAQARAAQKARGEWLETPEVTDVLREMEEDERNNMAMIQEVHRRPKRGFNKALEDERVENEKMLNAKVLKKFHTLERLWAALDDAIPRLTWCQLASQLIEIFSNVRSFFPKDKSKKFMGIFIHKRRRQMNIDERLARVYNLYDSVTEENAKFKVTSRTEFRGVSYERWFELFMRYALVLTLYEHQEEEAVSIVEMARTCAIFHHDKTQDHTMLMVRISLALMTGDYTSIMLNVRVLLNHNQFNSKVLRLFMLLLPSGGYACQILTSLNHQKYFLRQIKAYDSIKQGRAIPGMATISNRVTPEKENPYLLHIYYCLLSGGKSYVPSLGYALRAYKHFNKDPMLCFIVGLNNLHRSMQRLSLNRHFQVLQGFSYLMEYADLRQGKTVYEEQEVNYNFGRAFHMLGLTTLAVPYYEKVLAFEGLDEEYDLRAEAAYNLSLIYSINGNTELANVLTEKYLTI
ncbi:hypothetical protein BABINDRAFT_171250 [Babjeviella inositovora NRRL Y-12698]|uniref:Uncharacterized protein n=1 Tax=Babjeviella inositovora NRRL Y-12698 TaxID=984486 RepID=A0A1E3QRF8_9ASCO|nr:uncharacterized protein BABINDRAFT_171250 [Babjeviella inositovora NRRL Y-12698]ODQ80279.1 hypothetical protein BABINDRAFT_171250 [Babjeviella inositovora NRRL Y-12698]